MKISSTTIRFIESYCVHLLMESAKHGSQFLIRFNFVFSCHGKVKARDLLCFGKISYLVYSLWQDVVIRTRDAETTAWFASFIAIYSYICISFLPRCLLPISFTLQKHHMYIYALTVLLISIIWLYCNIH